MTEAVTKLEFPEGFEDLLGTNAIGKKTCREGEGDKPGKKRMSMFLSIVC